MFGKNARLTSLELRKRLLLAESELNRAQLADTLAALKADIRALRNYAKYFGTIASAGAALVATLRTLRRRKPAEAAAKPSWLRVLLKGARIISTLWLAFRAKERSQDGV